MLDYIARTEHMGLYRFEGIIIPHDYELRLDTFGTVDFEYKQDYLRKGEEVYFVYVERCRDKIWINASYPLTDEERLYVSIAYDNDNKIIIYEPISITKEIEGKIVEDYRNEKEIRKFLEENQLEEEIINEFQEYVLYDVILKSWVGRGWDFMREKEKLQHCEIMDLTFSNE